MHFEIGTRWRMGDVKQHFSIIYIRSALIKGTIIFVQKYNKKTPICRNNFDRQGWSCSWQTHFWFRYFWITIMTQYWKCYREILGLVNKRAGASVWGIIILNLELKWLKKTTVPTWVVFPDPVSPEIRTICTVTWKIYVKKKTHQARYCIVRLSCQGLAWFCSRGQLANVITAPTFWKGC